MRRAHRRWRVRSGRRIVAAAAGQRQGPWRTTGAAWFRQTRTREPRWPGHSGLASEQGLHAGHLVLQGLVLVRAGVDFHYRVDARAAHGVNRLVAGLDSGKQT
jgi:hypothetical protein